MKDVVPEHHIQKKLFNSLITSDGLRYSELKPKELEANLFMYHLKELIKLGLVEKIEGKYRLSMYGKQVATRFSVREESIRLMPSTISVVVLKALDGELLLYRRKRQPYIDAVGFPSGKIHVGDSLLNAANREMGEKCDYTPNEVRLRHVGMLNIVENNDNVSAHIIAQVWRGEVSTKKQFANHAGETFWADWRKYETEFMAGTKELMQALASDDFFHLDLMFS